MSSGNSRTSSCPAFLSTPSSPQDISAKHGTCSGSGEAQALAEPLLCPMKDSAAHAEKVQAQHAVHSSLAAALQDAGRSPSYRLRKAALTHASLVDVPMKFVLEPLTRYSAAPFFSGLQPLDDYFRCQALEDAHSGTASVIIARSATLPGKILGFYTLAATALDADGHPGIPAHADSSPGPIPAVLMERFAFDPSLRGQGIEELLLVNALLRAYKAPLGWRVFLGKAAHEGLEHFFRFFGFQTLSPHNPSLLWLTRREVHKLPGARTE